MKTLLLLAILAVTRPPALDPNDVPFVYDPNMCLSDVLGWVVTEPNTSVIWTMTAHNKYGLRVDLYAPNTVIQRLAMYQDLEGYVQEFQLAYTPETDGVHYIDVTATDLLGQQDSRTVLVLAVTEDPPVIKMESVPIVRMKQAQQLWQVAKKEGKQLTSPARVWK